MIQSPRNAVHACGNPYQGQTRKVLCVCSAGLLRSPTVANVLREMYGFNVRCAGANQSYALVPLSTALMTWADDVIFVDRSSQLEWLMSVGKETIEVYKEKVVVWDIPDDYEYMHPGLVAIVQRKAEEMFGD